MKSAARNKAASEENSSRVASLNFSADTSPAGSIPRRRLPSFLSEASKPMVRKRLPNSTASGSPT